MDNHEPGSIGYIFVKTYGIRNTKLDIEQYETLSSTTKEDMTSLTMISLTFRPEGLLTFLLSSGCLSQDDLLYNLTFLLHALVLSVWTLTCVDLRVYF